MSARQHFLELESGGIGVSRDKVRAISPVTNHGSTREYRRVPAHGVILGDMGVRWSTRPCLCGRKAHRLTC